MKRYLLSEKVLKIFKLTNKQNTVIIPMQTLASIVISPYIEKFIKKKKNIDAMQYFKVCLTPHPKKDENKIILKKM